MSWRAIEEFYTVVIRAKKERGGRRRQENETNKQTVIKNIDYKPKTKLVG